VEVNIINNEVEKEDYKTCPDGGMRIRWQRRKHNAQDTMPKRYPNRWGRGRHKIGDIEDINMLQWCE
jgi:hypothetical protein